MPAKKKDPSVRARRNVATTASKLTAGARDVPDMPAGPIWHSETVRWWNDVWSSPMSPEWDESDEHNVILCALLYNDIWLAETAKERKDAAGEFRLQRRDLGLTPYDRRRLEWTIESADEARDRGRQRRARQLPEPVVGVDPRNVLRAVN
jgi:hypothetical protein